MISRELSQQAREDFSIVLKMAQTIGLADHPPASKMADPYIVNIPVKRTRKRRCNHSDLSHIEKEEKAKKVRERSMSQRAADSPMQSQNARKNSVKDVFVNELKPYDDPLQFIHTQKQILRNEMARFRRYSKTTQRVQQMTRDKKRRSGILGQISDGVVVAQSQPPKRYMTPMKYFGQKRSKVVTPRTTSQQKLAVSLNFNKFQIIPRKGFVGLLSRESCRSRMVQTARDGTRLAHMHFNQNNKAELLYPGPFEKNESSLLFQF